MSRKFIWMTGALLVGLLGAGGAVLRYRRVDVVYTSTQVDRGSIQDVVEATGTINAVTTVQVGSQVSGTILKLYVDFNSHVQRGQVIAKIDPRTYEGQVLQARADLTNSRAFLAAAKSNLLNAKAKATQSRADYERTDRLAKEGLLSQQQLDSAKAQAEANDAQVAANERKSAPRPDRAERSDAAQRRNKTGVHQNYCPVDGTVVNRRSMAGEPWPPASNSDSLHHCPGLEKNAGLCQHGWGTWSDPSGQKVSFRVDAFPNEFFVAGFRRSG